MEEVTQILNAVGRGEGSSDELLTVVYEDLRRLAARKLARERPGQTLQATALVHEAYLRVVGGGDSGQAWENRRHFFKAAAQAMRRILIDQARRKHATKHGGDARRVELEERELTISVPAESILDLDQALEQLAAHAPQEAELLRLRYFTGLTIEETAEVLGISRKVAFRYWRYGKAFLSEALSDYEISD